MKRSFSPMKAQQAPTSSPPAPRQDWPMGALQIASSNAQRMIPGIVTARKNSARIVKTVLNTLLNKLARSQAMTPCVRGGGLSTGSGRSCAMSVIGLALDQRDVAVIEVHHQRDRQAD